MGLKDLLAIITILVIFTTFQNFVSIKTAIPEPQQKVLLRTSPPTSSPTAPPPKPMFVVSTNEGFWNFFLNWHYHARSAVGVDLNDRLIVVPKDNKSHELAVKMGIKHIYSPLHKQSQVAVNYETKNYKKMVSRRPRILKDLLDSFPDRDLIYLDVDTVMLRDITELIDYDMDFMSGIEVLNYNGHAQYYCSGIMFIKNNDKGRMVLTEWMDEMEKSANVNQPTFNRILYSHDVKFDGFPQLQVLSGSTAKQWYKERGPLDESVYLVHANYLQGSIAKAEFLNKYGLWKRTGNMVISICTASRSDSKWVDVKDSYLWRILIQSVHKATKKDQFYKYDMRLYVAVDDDDMFWIEHLGDLQRLWNELSPHPLTVIPKVIPKTHSIPWNEITLAAYHEGSDYFVRVNDDSEFVTENWADIIVDELKTMDNFGAIGPKSLEGNREILVHDAVHKTHIELFGFYYPPFRNWFIDDWITYVYRHRTKILKKLRIKHHIYNTRYKVHTPAAGVYESIIKETAELALKYPIEKRVVVITNGHKCAMPSDHAFYFESDIDKAAETIFPTWYVVCHNDTVVQADNLEKGFKFHMLGSIDKGKYHISHATDYMLYGKEAIALGPAFKGRKQDKLYTKKITRR